MQTKKKDEKECCRVLAAGVGVKAADLTADPIDGYSGTVQTVSYFQVQFL